MRQAMLAACLFFLSCGGAAQNRTVLRDWDACDMVTLSDATQVLDQAWTEGPGIADIPWNGRLAQSRCEYMADGERSIALFAEASSSDYPTSSGVKSVLKDQGYRLGVDLPPTPLPDASGTMRGFWVTIDAEGGHHRGELHLFFDRTSLGPVADGGLRATRRVHAYVALYLTDLPLFVANVPSTAESCRLPGQETPVLVACGLMPQIRERVWRAMGRLDLPFELPVQLDSGVVDAPSDATGHQEVGDAGLPVEEFASEMAFRFCRRQQECCATSEGAGGVTGDGETACLVQVTTALSVLAAGTSSAQVEGRVLYDRARAVACAAALDSATCDELKAGQSRGLPCLEALHFPGPWSSRTSRIGPDP